MPAADPRGPFSRAPALPQPRVGRPRGPAASSRVRRPGGCSHVTGAGGSEPAHGEHLPGERAQHGPGPRRVSGREAPGVGGRGAAGGAGWPETRGRRGSEFGAAGSGEAAARLAVVAGGGSTRGADFSREQPPRPLPALGPPCCLPVSRPTVSGGGRRRGGGLSSPWGPRPPAGCPRSSRRAGVAAAPEEQRLVPAGGDGASAVRGSGRARGASRGRRGLPASAPALPDPGARGARSPSAWTHPAAPPGCDKMDLTYRRALTVTRSLKAVLQQQTQI